MDESYRNFTRPQSTGSLKPAVWMAGGAFLLGVAVVAVLWWQGFGSGDLVRVVREEPTELASPPAPPPAPNATASGDAQQATAKDAADAVAKVEQVAEQQGGLDSRVAAMEQRLSKLDLQAQAAAGNAARAEGLLVVFAARRSIERGVPLGYLEDQLKLRFGDARPNAVATVIAASRDPVTLDRLIARLDGLAPNLTNDKVDDDAFSWIGRELSGLFVVRHEDTPSPQPEKRLERARLFLESARTEAAVSEVRNLPNADLAAGWIEDAERYAKAQRALELLETTAILESTGLRDGTGNAVEQLSPASDKAG
ncbi:hypothetical protein GRI89_07710 [Altererythrobacter salegens]|uniref:Inner membrane protein n=1 Tax=Croceibacterium salegens TaxID=1737568 RepID=A0A6I4SU22_9SPHN|nr:hypothetical protein [Croceibacterium salegens]MXO59425.1 hypothetical protein [Croceibacterium salegens]